MKDLIKMDVLMLARRITFLLAVLFLCSSASLAQTILPIVPGISLEDIYELNKSIIRSSVVVIKNENDILPIRRLDTLNILSIRVGEDDPEILYRRLSSYTLLEHYWINSEELKQPDESLEKNLVVLTVGQNSIDSQFIGDIIRRTNPILVWEGSVSELSELGIMEQCKAIVLTQGESEELLDRAIQILFGGKPAVGKLRHSLDDEHPVGYGIQLIGGLRFGFERPEDMGLNGEYLKVKLDSISRMAIDSGVAPGIQVLVARDQEIIYHQTWGYHTYDNEIPVRKSDIYDLASVTKITGALPALMKLHDEGKFELDGTLGDYIPYFKKGNLKNVTIRQILSHNGGLEAWIPYWTTTVDKNGDYKRSVYRKDSTEKYSVKLSDTLWLRSNYKKKIYKMIRKSKVDPDQGYLYSGLSFYLWPEIVTNLSGEGYEEYLKETFYLPLGAYSMGYNPLMHGISIDQIVPTEIDTFFRQMPLHGVVHDEGAALMGGVSSNAGLFSNTTDLAKVIQMYLNKGTYGGERFISENTIEKFVLCHYCNEGNRRGLAFDKPVLENKENGSTALQASDHSFGHSGYTGTFAWADPDNGILFIFMSNRVYPTRNNRKLYQLNIRPSMHQVVYDAIIK